MNFRITFFLLMQLLPRLAFGSLALQQLQEKKRILLIRYKKQRGIQQLDTLNLYGQVLMSFKCDYHIQHLITDPGYDMLRRIFLDSGTFISLLKQILSH